jgi:hypothetical protein
MALYNTYVFHKMYHLLQNNQFMPTESNISSDTEPDTDTENETEPDTDTDEETDDNDIEIIDEETDDNDIEIIDKFNEIKEMTAKRFMVNMNMTMSDIPGDKVNDEIKLLAKWLSVKALLCTVKYDGHVQENKYLIFCAQTISIETAENELKNYLLTLEDNTFDESLLSIESEWGRYDDDDYMYEYNVTDDGNESIIYKKSDAAASKENTYILPHIISDYSYVYVQQNDE